MSEEIISLGFLRFQNDFFDTFKRSETMDYDRDNVIYRCCWLLFVRDQLYYLACWEENEILFMIVRW